MMTHKQYETMGFSILDSREWYQQISVEVTSQFKYEFKQFICTANLETLIDKETYEYLNVPFPRDAILNSLPKINKNRETPPGRPIVAGIGSITEHASRFGDFFLMPHVIRLPSYVRDTLDLL